MADTLELLTRPRMNQRPARRGLLEFLGIGRGLVIDPNDPRAPGIDISKWQTGINWAQVGQNFPPLAYAFVKSTESIGYMSSAWRAQWDNLALLGIPRSSYHFWRGNQTGAAQAAWFLSKSAKGELPPVLDVEDADNVPQTLTTAQKLVYVANIRAWLDAVQSAWGQMPIIYTGAWFWNRLGVVSWANEYPGWFATYRTLDQYGPIIPLGWERDRWRIWQYSSSGTVSGFPERVDLNAFNGTRAEFKEWAGLTPPPSVEDRLADLERRVTALEQK